MTLRLAVRAVIVENGQLLLVNAFPHAGSTLWCAPGGGVEAHSSLPDNLVREVHEETGLTVRVGPLCLVNEFHNPDTGFHQVEVFFRCTVEHGALDGAWSDPESIVTRRRFVTRTEMAALRFKPDSLCDAAFGEGPGYDPLEVMVKP